MTVVWFILKRCRSPGAARAGVENLSRSLSVEWASQGVRINCVSPGVVFSPTARDNYQFDVLEASRPHIPAKRLGSTREVWLMDWISRRDSQHLVRLQYFFS